MTSRPVLITMSVLAGAQVLVGGAALGDVIGKDAAGLAIIAVAAIQAGMQFYVQGQVTPTVNVAAQRRDDGRVVAGPAATAVLAGDANVGEPVKVEIKPPTVGGV
jgi:hypothetical protein